MGKRGEGKPKRPRPAAAGASTTLPGTPGIFKHLRCRHKKQTAQLKNLFLEARPFPHLFVEGVFDDRLLAQAREELLAGEWFRKRVDLYDFLQTDHLRRQASVASAVATIQDALYGSEFRSWMEVRNASAWPFCFLAGCDRASVTGMVLAWVILWDRSL